MSNSPQRILLAVTGLSPQIVTETLHALLSRPGQAWIPDEIHLVSTAKGADNARLQLLSEKPGWFHRLRSDYKLPAIAFPESHIHVIRRADGSLLEDIRDDADNALAADFICEKVRELTADAQSELHASIAGGRKTMGFYLGYAMSLYGRPQDRLSHVLVSEPFETQKDFFYPTPVTHVIQDQRTGLALDCRDARIWLGDIPFVRLRENLPHDLIAGKASYSVAVAEVQKALPPLQLVLRPASREAVMGGESIHFTPIEYAYYWLFADRARRSQPGLHWSDDALIDEVLDKLAKLINLHSGEYEKTEKAYRSSYGKDNFDPIKSKINKKITQALGRRGEAYKLATQKKAPGQSYRLTVLLLPHDAITLDTHLPYSQGEFA
ncbi:MAG: CRISPR-associated ring nuclease Csm6 [Thiomonas sp.]|uniref:CRISPR-associated ring nuclease Csm6 n=1 Tax=Thiomonas sp. TaxID=2047785 RepID=UPI002A3603DA|nr:CRISPR-associated ring nuclease Csm6 [Thiomonas sp.]MDY0331670.1 CRISPR-associated ring nuclease Csm6 [Thiomonas sp.]